MTRTADGCGDDDVGVTIMVDALNRPLAAVAEEVMMIDSLGPEQES